MQEDALGTAKLSKTARISEAAKKDRQTCMIHNLNSFKGGSIRDHIGDYYM